MFILALVAVACDNSDEIDKGAVLELKEGQSAYLEFNGFAQSESVSFVSKVNWMVRGTAESDWFTVEPMFGEAGDATITVSVMDYNGEEPLSGGFDIVAGGHSITITVKQRSATDPESEYVYIPDARFLDYLVKNFDTDGDGHISHAEAEAVEEIVCTDCAIESVEGIKNFKNLKKLNCSYNAITATLDLVGMTSLEELYAHHNLYTKLDVEDCTNLRRLEANDNVGHTDDFRSIFHTKEVNLKGCSALTYIELTDNAIETIDLSSCPKLEVLRMTWNNLTTIDLTKCPKLTHLYIRKNTELQGVLDLTQNPNIVEVWCGESSLTGVNFATECLALETLICYDSKIETLNLSSCPNLKTLEAHSMALTALDVTGCPKLEHLWLKFNEVEELDLTNCPLLSEVQIGYNKIKSLDLSHSPLITILEATYNGLTDINLDGCENLITLNVAGNNLSTIDLSDCSMLFQVSVADNQLTMLDVSNKPELVVLNFENNLVEELNIEGCPYLSLFYAANNKLSELDLRIAPLLQEVSLSNNELETLYVAGLKHMYQCEFQMNRLERLDLTGCTAISELYVQDNPLAYFSVFPCTSLSQLDMRRTAMKSIDLSNNAKASFLFAQENPQLETVYIAVDAEYSSLMVDEHVEVWYKEANSFDNDVDNGNWGDEDLNPWSSGNAA